MSWTDDGAVPVAHHDIVAIFQTIRTRPVSDSLFTLFQLFEQLEISWNCKAIVRIIGLITKRLSYLWPWLSGSCEESELFR